MKHMKKVFCLFMAIARDMARKQGFLRLGDLQDQSDFAKKLCGVR